MPPLVNKDRSRDKNSLHSLDFRPRKSSIERIGIAKKKLKHSAKNTPRNLSLESLKSVNGSSDSEVFPR